MGIQIWFICPTLYFYILYFIVDIFPTYSVIYYSREVLQGLHSIDPKKSDGLDPFFLKIAAQMIAQPVTDIFNLSLSSHTLPAVWKQALVSPLLKAGDPSIPDDS